MGTRSVRGNLISAAACAAALIASGCARQPPPPEPSATPRSPVGYRRAWSDEDVERPTWIADPTRGGTLIAAWGSTMPDPRASHGTLRDRAMHQARDELARMVRVRIQSVLRDYLAESRQGETGSVVAFTESVSRAVADRSVEASFQRDAWVHPKTGELFVLAVVDRTFAANLSREIGDQANASPTGDAHLRAKLGADQASAELDRLLSAGFTTP